MFEHLDLMPIACHYNSPQRSMKHMKNPTTLLALSLLVALITLQSTQAADILVDDFTSTSFTGDSGRLKETRIDLGWQTHWDGAVSSWGIAGGELTTASGASTDQEGGVAQVFSYGADANTEATFSFDYNVTADDTLSVHLWGMDGTYEAATDSRVVNFAVLGKRGSLRLAGRRRESRCCTGDSVRQRNLQHDHRYWQLEHRRRYNGR
jgi:hypothetical protein